MKNWHLYALAAGLAFFSVGMMWAVIELVFFTTGWSYVLTGVIAAAGVFFGLRGARERS